MASPNCAACGSDLRDPEARFCSGCGAPVPDAGLAGERDSALASDEAAGDDPVDVAGVSEGLSGSSLNAGNYNSSRRSTADTTLANVFRTACGALQTVLDVPDGAELWYYADDVPFLQEDQADAAAIRSKDALTLESLIRGGFTPDSAVTAVTSGQFESLEHTGLVSVQLQPPGSGDIETDVLE